MHGGDPIIIENIFFDWKALTHILFIHLLRILENPLPISSPAASIRSFSPFLDEIVMVLDSENATYRMNDAGSARPETGTTCADACRKDWGNKPLVI